ncbi:MAG: squalene synthase HpnC [Janthinobacterium lividum]
MNAPAPTVMQRLEGAPVAYLEPTVRPTLAEAQAWCKALAGSHYENFHVATYFLPKQLRPHFHALYAYCRVSDDLGDEVADHATALRLLNTWGTMLDECYDAPTQSRHPVYVALRQSIEHCDLPRQPFADLLQAFRDDQTKTRFADLAELEDYSRYSANPVGSLVLYTCGYADPALHALSDSTCTALQLANFWQDVGEDLRERDRVYLPADRMARHGVTESDLLTGQENDAYRALLQELVRDTRAMLLHGAPLIDRVDRELAATLRLFTEGGLAILQAIEQIDYNTLSRRPEVSKGAKLRLLVGAGLGKLGVHRGSKGLR